MFHGWDSFYLLVGGAAGALIGIMFVVATLTAGLDPSRTTRGSKIFITPIVFHFAVVLAVSAVTAAPELSAAAVGAIFAALATAGLVYAVVTTVRVFRLEWDDAGDWSDRFFYGLAPIAAYLALAWAAASVWAMPDDAPYEIAAVAVFLLLLGIRDAWDLAIALIKSSPERK